MAVCVCVADAVSPDGPFAKKVTETCGFTGSTYLECAPTDSEEVDSMKAAVLHSPNEPLTIEEVALARPRAREVLLRTAFAGLCHSDLHFIEGLYSHPTPCVLGHESSAIVEAVGDDVTYVKPGDHVITCLSVFCGTCSQCVTGHPNLCESTDVKMPPGVSRRLSWRGGELMHQFLNLSSFAE